MFLRYTSLLKNHRIDILLPFILTAIFYTWRLHGAINPLDEGTFLAIAQALIEGKKLYRDVWFQYGPLVALPLKAAVSFFTPTLWTIRVFVWIANLTGLLCIYLSIQKFIPSRIVRLITVTSLWMIPLAAHTTTIPMAARYGPPFLSLLFWPNTINPNDRNAVGYPFICGLLCGALFFNSQEVAVAAIVAGAVVFVLHPTRNVAFSRYLAGLALSALGFGIFISMLYGLKNYLGCTINETAALLASRKNIFTAFSLNQANPWQGWAEIMALFFPLLTITLSIFILVIKNKILGIKKIQILGLISFVLIFSIPAWGRTDRWHIYYSLSPSLLLAAFILGIQQAENSKFNSIWLCSFALLVLLMTWPHAFHDAWRNPTSRSSSLLNLPRSGGVKLPSNQANAYEVLVLAIDQKIPKNEPLLTFPYDGALYFLSNRSFPCRFPLPIEAVTPKQQDELAHCIETSSVHWIVWDRENNYFDGRPVEARLKKIVDIIQTNFTLETEYGPFVFLKRN